jgi:hypothetical protein
MAAGAGAYSYSVEEARELVVLLCVKRLVVPRETLLVVAGEALAEELDLRVSEHARVLILAAMGDMQAEEEAPGAGVMEMRKGEECA